MEQNMQRRFQNRNAASDAAAEGRADDAAGQQEAARSLRALLVLDHLARAQHPPTLAQLAQRLDMPKTTLMRLLAAMQRAGYVAATPTENGFVPGPQATSLALATLRACAFTRACRAVLTKLVGTLGETCNLTAPDGDRVVYMERVETSEPLRLFFAVGSHVPMHCTASGKLFLASMNRLERSRVLARLPLTRNTPRTLTDPARLEAELERQALHRIAAEIGTRVAAEGNPPWHLAAPATLLPALKKALPAAAKRKLAGTTAADLTKLPLAKLEAQFLPNGAMK